MEVIRIKNDTIFTVIVRVLESFYSVYSDFIRHNAPLPRLFCHIQAAQPHCMHGQLPLVPFIQPRLIHLPVDEEVHAGQEYERQNSCESQSCAVDVVEDVVSVESLLSLKLVML